MAVTEVLRGLGSWGIQLSADTPKEILDALQYFGHITVHTGPVDPRVAGDSMLASSRYAGIYRGRGAGGDQFTLIGPGMAAWLGDEDGKGEVFETAVVINHDFSAAIPLLLPPGGSITAGTIYTVNPGTPFVGTFQYETPRSAIDYLCETVGAEWRVNNDGTLDAGLESDLFAIIPKAAVRRRGAGLDMFLKSLPGNMSTEQDMNDFTTRTLLLASGTEGSVVTATADIAPGLNPFLDLHGNPVKMTRIISESDTDATNAPARAQLQLNRFSGPRNAVTMSTSEYDLKGDVQVGDYLWAYDPEADIYDTANEVVFRGERFWPMRLRLTEMTWPVVEGMSVAYRRGNGTWYDLTPYVQFENGDTTMVVGGYNRSLTGGDGGPGGPRPIPDSSVPDAPTWNTSLFRYSAYQSPVDGNTRAQVELNWNRPLNVDTTPILDGDHYEIRYRASSSPIFPTTHAQMAALTHNTLALGTHEQPLVYPVGAWLVTYVPFDELTGLLQDLPTNMPYEVQVRAVDGAKPPNAGDWSASAFIQTSQDTIPPATPAPPSVAASKLAIQVVHTLGVASGGIYNLDPDLHHLEVHGGSLTGFAPDEGTLLGKVIANAGTLRSQVPVVATFSIDKLFPVFFKVIAVDNDGNASAPSSAVSATAELIDDAHISSLTVSKITAGTITADWIVSARIATSLTGARAEMQNQGFIAYDSKGRNTVWLANDGRFFLRMYDTTSQMRIEDVNGVARFVAGNSEVSIRDPLGNSVFSNVTAAGWGVTEPAMAIPFNPFNIADENKMRFTGPDYQTMWIARMPVSHPKLYWGYYWQVLFETAVGATGIGWSYAAPPEFAPPSDGLIYASGNRFSNDDAHESGVYTWPTGMYGQIVYVFLFSRMTSGSTGTGFVGINPEYLFGRGY